MYKVRYTIHRIILIIYKLIEQFNIITIYRNYNTYQSLKSFDLSVFLMNCGIQ